MNKEIYSKPHYTKFFNQPTGCNTLKKIREHRLSEESNDIKRFSKPQKTRVKYYDSSVFLRCHRDFTDPVLVEWDDVAVIYTFDGACRIIHKKGGRVINTMVSYKDSPTKVIAPVVNNGLFARVKRNMYIKSSLIADVSWCKRIAVDAMLYDEAIELAVFEAGVNLHITRVNVADIERVVERNKITNQVADIVDSL